MTDETQGESPAEDAPILPVETPAAESSTAPEGTPEQSAEKVETPRDEEGKFISPKVQKRIDHLTWEKNKREREAEYWRQQALQQQQKPKEPAAKDRPKLADFEFDEAKYSEALDAWYDSRFESKWQEKTAAQKEAERTQRFIEKLNSKPELARAALGDYTFPVNQAMSDVVKDSEVGVELLEWIDDNREEARRIQMLPPHLSAKELGRIEERLMAQKSAAKRPPQVSKAPPPPPTVDTQDTDTGYVRASDPESDKLSVSDWMKRREKELRKKR